MRVTTGVLFGIVLLLATPLAGQKAPQQENPVLLRLTAEPMGNDLLDIPIVVQRVDKPGQPVQLVARAGAVDATVLTPGVYELRSLKPVKVNGLTYEWRMQIPIFEHITRVRLSIANAVAVTVPEQPKSSPVVNAEAKPPEPPKQSARTEAVQLNVSLDDSLRDLAQSSNTTLELRRIDRPAQLITAPMQKGIASVRVPPGTYQIVTAQPIVIGARKYHWDIEAPITEPTNELRLSEWQAVVIGLEVDTEMDVVADAAEPTEKAPPATPPAAKRSQTPPVPERQAVASNDSDELAIRQLLEVWIRSLHDRQLQTHVACYAPRMERYFLRTNVDREQVRRDKERFLRRFPVLNKLEISDIRVRRAGDTAEATFLKTWDFIGNRPFRGQVASRLLLEKIEGRWLITMEREHYVRNVQGQFQREPIRSASN